MINSIEIQKSFQKSVINNDLESMRNLLTNHSIDWDLYESMVEHAALNTQTKALKVLLSIDQYPLLAIDCIHKIQANSKVSSGGVMRLAILHKNEALYRYLNEELIAHYHMAAARRCLTPPLSKVGVCTVMSTIGDISLNSLENQLLALAIEKSNREYISAAFDMIRKTTPKLMEKSSFKTQDSESRGVDKPSDKIKIIVWRCVQALLEVVDSTDMCDIHEPYESQYDATGNYEDRDMPVLKIENPLLYKIRCVFDHEFVRDNIDPRDHASLFTGVLTLNKTKSGENLELIRYFLHSKLAPKNLIENSSVLDPRYMERFDPWQHVINSSRIFDYLSYHPEMKNIPVELIQNSNFFKKTLSSLSEERVTKVLEIVSDKHSHLYDKFNERELQKNSAEILLEACKNKSFDAFNFALNSNLMPIKLDPTAHHNNLFKLMCKEGLVEQLKYLVSEYNIKTESNQFLKIVKSWNRNSLESFMKKNNDLSSVVEIKDYMGVRASIKQEKKKIEVLLSNTGNMNNQKLENPSVPRKKSHKI